MSIKSERSIGIWIIAAVAVLFGLLTIKSGGSVLFIDGPARQAAGNYVPFVVWFNFLAGFIYIIAGAGLWMQKHWAVWLSVVIVLATLIVFAIFGIVVLNGEPYEVRTVAAMNLRTAVWTLITMFTYRKIIHQ